MGGPVVTMIQPRLRQPAAEIAARAVLSPRFVSGDARDPADKPGGLYQFVEDGSCVVVPYAMFGLTGSVYDDAKTINEALGQAGASGLVRLIPGATYNTYTPIDFSLAATAAGAPALDGGMWSLATQNDFAGLATSSGTVIKPAFTGFTGDSVIRQVNATAAYVQGFHLRNLTIESNLLTGGQYGVLLQGGVVTGSMHGVMIHRASSDNLRIAHDPTGGLDPDNWWITECKFSASRSGNGVNNTGSSFADSVFDRCEASENALGGYSLTGSTNLRMIGCKAENNAAGPGYAFGGNTQLILPVQLFGCTSQLNNQDGFIFTGGAATYMLTGCRSWSDGLALGTTYAGFRMNGSTARVILSGCVTTRNGAGTAPAYGASETGTSFEMVATGCYFEGATAATHDDATNTHALLNQVPVPF